MKKLRIVILRFGTARQIVPLYFFVPRGFGFVHHSIALLYHEVPNPNLTIRNFFHRCKVAEVVVKAAVGSSVAEDARRFQVRRITLQPADGNSVWRRHRCVARAPLRCMRTGLAGLQREREWTWWAHTGGGKAVAFKPLALLCSIASFS
jgi:hypothetical protein